MAKIKLQVTQEGWSVEVQAGNEEVQSIAGTFIRGRHEIEVQTGPEYARELVEKLETLSHLAYEENEARQEEALTREAESIHDSSSPNGSPENLTS